MSRFGFRRIRLLYFRIWVSRSAAVSTYRCAKSLFLPHDQRYSTGFSSGVYAGNRCILSQCRCNFRKFLVSRDVCAPSPSQRSTSIPLMWRRSSLRVRITSVDRIVRVNIRKNNFGFLPCVSVMMTPTTDRDFQLPVERMIGVYPFGAQVRRTVGFCEIPDSSQNPRQAPRFFAPFLAAARPSVSSA